jgi:hypothetical protein
MPLRPFHSPGAGFEQRLTMALALALMAIGAVLLVQLLLPWLVVGGLALAGFWLWRRHKARDHALHQLFYAELIAHGGRISVLDFAIAAQITGSEARRFLDQRAKEFWGDFEPTAAGDVLYTFPSQQAQPPEPERSQSPEPAPAASPSFSLDSMGLALRLGCSEAELAQQRRSLTFAAWSRQRDPDGCGWRYDAAGDRFWPEI